MTVTRTYAGEPLARVHNLQGGCAELTAAKLRTLARALNEVAADCEAWPLKGDHHAPTRRDYLLLGATLPGDGVVIIR